MFDWNPNDPDTVKVHYDVSAWTIDQRAELSEALAEDEITHVWDGDELVVPEEVEAQADELFSRSKPRSGHSRSRSETRSRLSSSGSTSGRLRIATR